MTAHCDPSLVYFVGAGPGDPELITLKGHRLLGQADVVIYAGSLINPALLDYCKAGASCHDSAELSLGQIIDLMASGVAAGKLVVRLQTGDLSLYGSIREQGEELAKLGIGFRSVPGVSSFLGAASELGIEYTVPEVSQSLVQWERQSQHGEVASHFALHRFGDLRPFQQLLRRHQGGHADHGREDPEVQGLADRTTHAGLLARAVQFGPDRQQRLQHTVQADEDTDVDRRADRQCGQRGFRMPP